MTNLFTTESKPIPVTKQMVKEAYRKVNSKKTYSTTYTKFGTE